MSTTSLLARLDAHQAAMLASIARAADLLECGASGAGEYRPVERGLTQTLKAYQLFKHGEIFDPAIASNSPSREEAGRRLKQDCLTGGENFRSHVRRWREADLADEWASFQPVTRALMRHLRDHVRAEGVQIRLLLAESR